MKHAKNFTWSKMCKGEDCIIVSGKLALLGWASYFSELLNGRSNEHLITERAINTEIRSAANDDMLSSIVDGVLSPTFDVIKEVIMGMKNNKTLGTDKLQAELFKYDGSELKKEITDSDQVWEVEEMLAYCKKFLFVHYIKRR
jgi:hypothetical protein